MITTTLFGLILGVGVAALLTLLFGVYTIGPTERGVLTTFGRAQRTNGTTDTDPTLGALLTNEESKGVRFTFKGDMLVVSSRAPEMGEAEIRVPMSGYVGDAIEIGFQPAFIVDALKVIDGQQVMIEMRSPQKPGVFKVGQEFTYVVMPVNVV